MTDTGVQPQRTNRRGIATRENMLEAALKALATGDPAAVSANRIAKLIGATWGAVKYQFGDADGLWAAVLHRTAERRADVFIPADKTTPLQKRVAGIIDTLYDGLTATDSRAIENLRAALPRDPAELERLGDSTHWTPINKQEWREIMVNYFTAFPDWRWDITSLIASGDRVVCEFTETATFTEPYPIMPGLVLSPTGESLRTTTVIVLKSKMGSLQRFALM